MSEAVALVATPESSWKRYVPDPSTESPPILSDDALYGVLGEVTKRLTEKTEACPAAVLGSLLTFAGCYMNGSRHLKIANDLHFPILFVKIIGKSSKGRKGLSKNLAAGFFHRVDESFKKKIKTGLTSGEGLVAMVSDFYEKKKPNAKDTELVARDPHDQKIVIFEAEGARLFKVMERYGNTLSAIIRDLWDASDLAVENKNSPLRATRPLVSIAICITIGELKKCMQEVEIANGYANRFMPMFSHRTRVEPFGGTFDEAALQTLASKVRENALRSSTYPAEFSFTPAAREYWKILYNFYAENELCGMLGSLTARAEPMILRVAMIFAYYDGDEKIDEKHLRAANLVWEYSQETWQHIYGDSVGDPIADEILRYLRISGGERSKTDIHGLFKNNKSAEDLNTALLSLYEAQLIEIKDIAENGKRKFLYRAAKSKRPTKMTNSTNEPTVGSSSNSLDSSDHIQAGQS